MGFNKNKGISIVIAIILFAVFSLGVFLAPISHNLIFWLGYSFFALATALVTAMFVFLFNSQDESEMFFKLSHVKLAWAYFVVQAALSVWEIFFFTFNYFVALMLNCGITAIFLILILLVHAGTHNISKKEQKTDKKVLFVRTLKCQVDLIDSENSDIQSKIKALSETIRFSDPMSHSQLNELETQILENIYLLEENIGNNDEAVKIITKIEKQLKERSIKCKELKGVKDVAPEIDNSGAKYVGTAFGILTFMAVIALTVCFLIIPSHKYDAANALFDLEKYPEAIVAFTEIIDFKDSKLKIEKANMAICQLQYDEAEELFNAGNYSEAINLYLSLGDFKESKLRIEQIYNRLSSGDIIYFGTYNNSPIEWKILKIESDKMLLMTSESIIQKPFSDEIKNVTWESSYLRNWLNSDFITSFSAEQQNQIISTDTGDTNDKVFLLSVDEMDELSDTVLFKTTDEWWTRTFTDNGVMYSSTTGWVVAEGDLIVRDKGVRPTVWISLE